MVAYSNLNDRSFAYGSFNEIRLLPGRNWLQKGELMNLVEANITNYGEPMIANFRAQIMGRAVGGSEDGSPRSLAEKVYHHVVDGICSGQLKPEARLTQRGLSAELKVSQVTVREAFERLEQQGWIERRRHRGVSVRSFSDREREEIYWVREMIEAAAVREVALHASDEQIARLRELVDVLSIACEKNDIELYQDVDIEFHRSLVRFVGNEHLREYYETIAGQIRSLLIVGAMKVAFHWVRSCELLEPISHEKIFRAIEAHDPDQAERLIRKHIQHGNEVIRMINRVREV